MRGRRSAKRSRGGRSGPLVRRLRGEPRQLATRAALGPALGALGAYRRSAPLFFSSRSNELGMVRAHAWRTKENACLKQKNKHRISRKLLRSTPFAHSISASHARALKRPTARWTFRSTKRKARSAGLRGAKVEMASH